MQQPHMQAGPSGRADSMAEDLFVMTAAGGLVRHRLTHTHSGGPTEAGPASKDRWVSVCTPETGMKRRSVVEGKDMYVGKERKRTCCRMLWAHLGET